MLPSREISRVTRVGNGFAQGHGTRNQRDMKSLFRMREYVQSVYACIIRSVENKNRLEIEEQVCATKKHSKVLDANGHKIDESYQKKVEYIPPKQGKRTRPEKHRK
jgi:hypothetical protein